MRTVVRGSAPREAAVGPVIEGVIAWTPEATAAERRKATGLCSHVCAHRRVRVVGEGPGDPYRKLVMCAEPDGCDNRCRGWWPGSAVIKFMELSERP